MPLLLEGLSKILKVTDVDILKLQKEKVEIISVLGDRDFRRKVNKINSTF